MSAKVPSLTTWIVYTSPTFEMWNYNASSTTEMMLDDIEQTLDPCSPATATPMESVGGV